MSCASTLRISYKFPKTFLGICRNKGVTYKLSNKKPICLCSIQDCLEQNIFCAHGLYLYLSLTRISHPTAS